MQHYLATINTNFTAFLYTTFIQDFTYFPKKIPTSLKQICFVWQQSVTLVEGEHFCLSSSFHWGFPIILLCLDQGTMSTKNTFVCPHISVTEAQWMLAMMYWSIVLLSNRWNSCGERKQLVWWTIRDGYVVLLTTRRWTSLKNCSDLYIAWFMQCSSQ